MNNHALSYVSMEKLKELRREQLVDFGFGEQSIRIQLQTELDLIKSKNRELQDTILDINGRYVNLKSKIFSPSSEKSKPHEIAPAPTGPDGSGMKPKKKEKKKRTDYSKLPSDRYPSAEIVEKKLSLTELPTCKTCNGAMSETDLNEISESITVVPKKFIITRQIRQKYRCSCCHGALVTTPSPQRIVPGGIFSDEMIIDIGMSKYLDLIPVERYAAIAARLGFPGLARNSLIEATHKLAEFLKSTKEKIKKEVQSSAVMWADETPHKMLEGDKSKSWYLWSFSCAIATYFECHGTRSGDVANAFLAESLAEVLLTDVYSGYGRAVDLANEIRRKSNSSLIRQAFCNAHSRRKFKEAQVNFHEESEHFLRCYRIIYRLEAMGREQGLIEEKRKRMAKIFDHMYKKSVIELTKVSAKSELAKAINYFQNNYEGLTLFLGNIQIPIDNNTQERLLRSPVIGRKTWYGTHSQRGADTAATLITIVESCKLIGVNPREYLKVLVQEIHQGNPPLTPSEYKERLI